jgi:hypothetical protein
MPVGVRIPDKPDKREPVMCDHCFREWDPCSVLVCPETGTKICVYCCRKCRHCYRVPMTGIQGCGLQDKLREAQKNEKKKKPA